jgi:subtilisin family serine protease
MSNMKKWGAALAFVALIAAASPASYKFLSGGKPAQDRSSGQADARGGRATVAGGSAAQALREGKASASATGRGQSRGGKSGQAGLAVMPRNRLPGGGFHFDESLNTGVAIERPAGPIQSSDSNAPGTFIVLFEEPALAMYRGGVSSLMAPPRTTGKTGKSRIDMQSLEAQNYLGYLQGRQLQMEEQMAGAAGRALEVRHRMQHAVNGIVVDMTAEESRRVAALPGVRLVEAYREYVADTDVGPTLIGAPAAWAGSANQPNGANAVQGQGIVIGMIDSGINFGSPSFAATDPVDGYVHQNPYGAGVFLGTCAAAGVDAGRCNDKLVGGYDFVCDPPAAQCGAANVREEPGFGDTNGHGSHTASTAGGNRRDVQFNGAALRISGVAPRANLIAYDACYTNTSTNQGLCPNVSTTASINQAVADGVDVINYSIGGGTQPWVESTSLAFLAATDAGVFVATSAGNSGPAANTLGHLEPWTSATAASQHGRGGFGTLMQVTGPAPVPTGLQPVVMYNGSGGVVFSATIPGTTPLRVSPGINTTTDGCNPSPFAAGSLTGAIAVIRRGTCGFSEKTNNAAAAGAIAVVIANNQAGIILPSVPGTTIPVFSVVQADGNALATFGLANAATATAQISFPGVGLPNVADALASFSSRGPAASFDLVKPDITAPGVDILAVLAGTTLTGSEALIGTISGTSMASPHNAGAAALMRQARPTWTVSEIKSALMMTATPQVYLEDQVTPANAFARGSGRIRLERALKAGLVLNETTGNYTAANPGSGGLLHTLNLPSMARGNCSNSCQFVRTFRNPGTSGGLWSLSVTGLTGTLDSSLIWVPAGATRAVTVTIDTSAIPANSVWNHGQLVMTQRLSGAQTASDSTLTLPIAVAVVPPVVSVPASVAASVASGANGSANFSIANIGGSVLNYTVATTGSGVSVPANALSTGVTSGFRNTVYSDPLTAGNQAQFAADDFTVGVTTQLVSLRTEGFVVSGAALTAAATSIRWSIFPDAAGLPGGDPFENPGTALFTFSAAPNAPGVSIAGGSITLNLAAAGQNVSLPPGKYWLVANTSGTFANRFAQYGSNTGNGGFATYTVPAAGGGAWAANTSFQGLTMTVRGQVTCGAAWLGAITPAAGALAGGASQPTSVVLNSSALAAGTYPGSLCVASNDPITPSAAVPVVLTVNP